MNKIKREPRGLKKFPFDRLQKLEALEIGEYTKDLMVATGSFVAYFNRSRFPKKLVQRKRGDKLVVIREK